MRASISRRSALEVRAVAVPSKPPTSRLAKRSAVEIIKEKSDYLVSSTGGAVDAGVQQREAATAFDRDLQAL